METNISILISKNISYVNYDANSAMWNQIYSGQIWIRRCPPTGWNIYLQYFPLSR